MGTKKLLEVSGMAASVGVIVDDVQIQLCNISNRGTGRNNDSVQIQQCQMDLGVIIHRHFSLRVDPGLPCDVNALCIGSDGSWCHISRGCVVEV